MSCAPRRAALVLDATDGELVALKFRAMSINNFVTIVETYIVHIAFFIFVIG